MRVGQSRFGQKSTTDNPINNQRVLLQCLESCQGLGQSQQIKFRMYRINSFLLALLKAQKSLSSQSIVKNMSCRPSGNGAIKYLSQLNGAQVKDSLFKKMFTYISQLTSRVEQLKQSFEGSFEDIVVQKYLDEQQMEKLTYLCLSELKENMKIDLKNRFASKQIYGLINFEWSTAFVADFISALNQRYHNLKQFQKQIEQIRIQLDSHQKKDQTENKINQNQVVAEYEQMTIEELLAHISNKNLAQFIQKQFQYFIKGLSHKENQCNMLQSRLDQCEQIIRRQMTMINQQQQENQTLKVQMGISQSQLRILNKKCEAMQAEFQQLNKQVQTLKQCNQVSKQSYYINPLWQKQQLQQKYYMEIIQLQSDLLIQKQQVQSLINIVLQEIKLSHEFFRDLNVSTFMFYRFDSEILKLLKTTNAFDKINLDEHLLVKQELQSESSPSIYKSTISTFSEVDTQLKMRSERQILHFQNMQDIKEQRQL